MPQLLLLLLLLLLLPFRVWIALAATPIPLLGLLVVQELLLLVTALLLMLAPEVAVWAVL